MINDKFILVDKKVVVCNDLLEWGKFMEKPDRIVKREKIGEVDVSTVFLGLDHNFVSDGKILVFETMIFGGEHDQYQDRCSTWEEAEKMHLKAVEVLR